MIKILAFPKDSNPYQILLYSNFDKKYFKIEYITGKTRSRSLNLIWFPIELLLKRFQGNKIFHLHWTYGFVISFPGFLSKYLSTLYLISITIFIKLLGYKLIWTIHNTVPHNEEFINDQWTYRFLSNLSDRKIVHSSQTIHEMRQLKYNILNTEVIPIGNYIGVYPKAEAKLRVRQKMDLPRDAFVLLFFGNILPYKGVEDLIREITVINKANVFLVISGRCKDLNLLNKLELLSNTYKNVKLFNNYIKNSEVSNFFEACDVVVFPFKKITTSSTAILAFSQKRSIIAPRIGDLKNLSEKVGFFYDKTDKNGLHNSIMYVLQHKHLVDVKGDQAFEYAKSLKWKAIAQETEDAFLSTLH